MAETITYERIYPGMYASLHVHTDGSDGNRLDYQKIKDSDITAVGITDHEVCHTAIEHYNKMKKIGKPALIGVELNTGNLLSSLQDISVNHNKQHYHLVIHVKNEIGLINYYKLITLAKMKKVLFKSQLDIKDIIDHREGLVCLSGCIGGEIPQYLLHGQYKYAETLAITLKEIFGDDFYLEIQRHNLEGEDKVNRGLVSLSEDLDIKLVATDDAHYMEEEDRTLHEIQLCKKFGQTFNDKNRMKLKGDDYALIKSIEAIEEKWKDMLYVLDNTIEVMEKCKDLEIKKALTPEDYHFPKFNTPDGFNEQVYFIKQCYEGFDKRVENNELEDTPETRERLDYEMNTMIELGFENYFLIVQKIVKTSQDKGIWVGPARGSVGGSLVAYALGITSINPMTYNFSFERFLNVYRKGMPDIDLDFDKLRRAEALNSTYEEYDLGESTPNIAYITAFNTWGTRGGINDVGRILGYKEGFYRGISKLIPDIPGITFEEAFETIPKFKEIYDEDEDAKTIIDYARQLVGARTSISRHASGLIIADKPLDNYIALDIREDKDLGPICMVQCNNIEAEELGLLKIDFLGLATGTEIVDTVRSINAKRKDGEKPFNIADIPLDDENVYYGIFGKGRTAGIFQSEAYGMTKALKETFTIAKQADYDINLLSILVQMICSFRPGPKDSIPEFHENLRNPDDIEYMHEKLKPVLEETFGILTYQEQVSKLFEVLAGYSPAKADLVRSSVSKKKLDVLAKEKNNFIYGNEEDILGCIENGIPEEIAIKIFDDIVKFGKYAFNKSHGGSYGILTYQTAYLKYHYPAEFMASILTSCCRKSNGRDKLATYIDECKRMGIKILNPCVNKSKVEFTVEGDNTIRFGLLGIKHIGEETCNQIVEERENGEYANVNSFVYRLNNIINSKVFQALALSGALDSFNNSRKYFYDKAESIIKNPSSCASTNLYELAAGIKFKNIPKNTDKAEEYTNVEIILAEEEYLGCFLDGNPLKGYEYLINDSQTNSFEELIISKDDIEDIDEDDILFKSGDTARVIGMVVSSEIKNNEYILYKITDGYKSMSGTANIRFKNALKVGNVVHINGIVDHNPSYGTQLKKVSVSRVFNSSEQLYEAENITVRQDSTVEAYISHYSEIPKFLELIDIDKKSSRKTTLYFSCNETKKKFKFDHKISLKNPIVLDFLKKNTNGLIIK